MGRQFVSVLVAVLIGALPGAHEICLAECSGNAATTAHSHQHDDGAEGSHHQMAGHGMDGSHVAMTGHHHEPAAIREMARATQCCGSAVVTPGCCRSQDASALLVPTVKRGLDPSQATVAQVIVILSPPVGAYSESFANTVIRPPVSLARLTSLRI